MFIICMSLLSISLICQTAQNNFNNIYDIIVRDMDSNKVELSGYKDKVLLIVNVASECGNTPQYKTLQGLYDKYRDEGFEILAFPCNDFGGQEPGSIEEIRNFCDMNYNITFKLFDKVKILGENKSALYERLINNTNTESGDVKWNFEKFLISKKGEIVARYHNKLNPMSETIVSKIEEELSKNID